MRRADVACEHVHETEQVPRVLDVAVHERPREILTWLLRQDAPDFCVRLASHHPTDTSLHVYSSVVAYMP